MPYLARAYQLSQSLIYHIFNRGNAREEIFHNKEDYQYFLNLLSNYAKNNNFRIYHWVLMPNHYHLLIEIDKPERISSLMAGIARSYVHYHHKKYGSSGHLWQGRFKSQPIQKELYLLACGRYIERNPVKSNIVSIVEDYPYSSAAYYTAGKEDGLTEEDPLFPTFGIELNQRREKYKEFLKKLNSEEEQLFENLESPRGSKEFLKYLVKENGLFLPRKKGRPRK